MAPKPLIESLNALPLPTYRNTLFGTRTLEYDHNGTLNSLTLSLESAKSISSGDFAACFDLIAATSSADYANSSVGWSPAKKRREMRLPDMRYIVVKKSGDSHEGCGAVRGFLSFMVTYEDGYEVVYCYEVHLAAELRGKGVGKRLMEELERIGKRAGMQKVMLTVLVANGSAGRFYAGIGYEEDEFSPGPRKLRGGTVRMPDHAILSKALGDDVRRPAHVTGKKRKIA